MPKSKSAGKVVSYGLRYIGCDVPIHWSVSELQEAYPVLGNQERVRIIVEPWPPTPKPKSRRKQIVYGPSNAPTPDKVISRTGGPYEFNLSKGYRRRTEPTNATHRKSIRRTIKALEKKIK